MSDPLRERIADVAAELLHDLDPFAQAVNRYAYRGQQAATLDTTSIVGPAADRMLNLVDQMRHDEARRAARTLIQQIRDAYTVIRRHHNTPTVATTADRLLRLHEHLDSGRPLTRRHLGHVARHLNSARVVQLSQLRQARQLHVQPCSVCGEPLGDGRKGICGSCRKFAERFGRHPTRAELDRRARGQNMRIRKDSIR